MNQWETLPPKEQAAHPNTPIERLRYLSHFHPGEVLQNPILPLLFLEDPEGASGLVLEAQKNFSEQVLTSTLERLTSEAQRRLWLCDCAERLLPFYETNKPGEHRPQEALNVARSYAQGGATVSALIWASAEANATRHIISARDRDSGSAIYFDHEPQGYVARDIAAVFARVAARSISTSDALDIASEIVELVVRVKLSKEPLDLHRDQGAEKKKLALLARVAELQWQALRINEIVG